MTVCFGAFCRHGIVPTLHGLTTPSAMPMECHTVTQDSAHCSEYVVFIAYPNMRLVDLACVQRVFWEASRQRLARGHGAYCIRMASLHGGLVQTAEGSRIDTLPLAAFDDVAIHTLVLSGCLAPAEPAPQNDELVAWLAAAVTRVARLIACGEGTWLLARTGALDGRRASIHWATSQTLREQSPQIKVDDHSLFAQSEAFWTCAGALSGIDLALDLIEADCGRPVSMAVARQLALFVRRPGRHAQVSGTLRRSQSWNPDVFHDLHVWIGNHLGEGRLTVDLLAEKALMSPRNFCRLYKRKTGSTPARAVEHMRSRAFASGHEQVGAGHHAEEVGCDD
ncbi:GlxA family transcriptional regulator [Pseudomonas sp. NPDC090202]|uniref:GlxA family transcriptional regulator n=1 Tax=unclassified Pseudomonas TaxID=196821 RepID=UPI0038180787